MAYKNKKKVEIKEQELPSFLFQSTEAPEDINFGKKTVENDKLGPIFFGCYEYQPMFHSLNLGLSIDVHKTASSEESLLHNAFRPQTTNEKLIEKKQVTGLCRKTQVIFSDPYLHRCPGQRKVFVPEPPRGIDLGETMSTIEGEASQEIPLYCFREGLDGEEEKNYNVIFLSDVWEKRRMYMSPNERMAHTHFPKQFVTVQVIGPTIPASIIIKKLPSKRKTDSQLDLALKSKAKTKKEAKEDDAKTEKPPESETEEKEDALPTPIEKPASELLIKSEEEAKEGSAHEEPHNESGVIVEEGEEEGEEEEEEEEEEKEEEKEKEGDAKDEEIKDEEANVDEVADEVPAE